MRVAFVTYFSVAHCATDEKHLFYLHDSTNELQRNITENHTHENHTPANYTPTNHTAVSYACKSYCSKSYARISHTSKSYTSKSYFCKSLNGAEYPYTNQLQAENAHPNNYTCILNLQTIPKSWDEAHNHKVLSDWKRVTFWHYVSTA